MKPFFHRKMLSNSDPRMRNFKIDKIQQRPCSARWRASRAARDERRRVRCQFPSRNQKMKDLPNQSTLCGVFPQVSKPGKPKTHSTLVLSFPQVSKPEKPKTWTNEFWVLGRFQNQQNPKLVSFRFWVFLVFLWAENPTRSPAAARGFAVFEVSKLRKTQNLK